MASTTIARRGFAGLYFLLIDGLAEAGERRASLDAFTGAFPAGLRMEFSSNRCVKPNILLGANLLFRKKPICLLAFSSVKELLLIHFYNPPVYSIAVPSVRPELLE
jgi:hypothetical protein